jgi:ankyrin repeat protein
VYCQLETLRRCFPAVIRHALNELPDTLDETYERTLLGIEKEKRTFAHRLFQCVTVAVRPLRVDELAEVLAIRFDTGQLPRYHADWQSEDAQEAVLSACSSLIAVVDVDGSPVVQFSHFSVKEYLTSDRLANSTADLSRYHVFPYSAHCLLAQASLGVLFHLSSQVNKNNIKRFPFAQYAAQYWVDHGRFENVSLNIQEAMERLFDLDEPSFATWIWIYDIDYPFRQHMFEDHPPPPEAVPLYYATLCGFRGLVEHLITSHPGDINARGGYHGSAMNAALVKRNVEIALLLLEHGADVNAVDARDYTPLCLAAEDGRLDDVKLLLEHHADVNLAERETSETPLIIAAREGELEIARLLLHHGATIDSLDIDGWTPLYAASRYGHLNVVRLLIQSGAAVDFHNHEGWTPLMVASRNGHLHVVQELLEHGAAINAQNSDLETSLHLASADGHHSIIELLIERYADVDKRNKDQQTPLDRATANGQLDVARLLLKSGSSLDSQDSNGSTPLHTAAHNGHLDVVKLLLESGADVSAQNCSNQIPLDVASASGSYEVTRYLANHMGVMDPCESMIVSPSNENAHDLVPDATPLSVGIVKHTNITGGLGVTSLLDACAEGNVEVVQSLLDEGANVNERNARHETALDVASTEGKLEVAKLLIKYGADVNCRDKQGWTPLLVASQYGHRDIVELLLNHGADVNVQQQDLWAPLHLASWNGHRSTVRLLLERGADIHARDIEGRTPSVLASRCGEQDLVRLLSGGNRVEG